jgi:hypothetical protein
MSRLGETRTPRQRPRRHLDFRNSDHLVDQVIVVSNQISGSKLRSSGEPDIILFKIGAVG